MPPPPLSAPELASVAWVGVVCGRVVVVATATCPGLPSSRAPPPVGCSLYVSARLGSPTVGVRLCRRSPYWWPHVLGCAAMLVGGGGAVVLALVPLVVALAWLCCYARWRWGHGRHTPLGCVAVLLRLPVVGAWPWRLRSQSFGGCRLAGSPRRSWAIGSGEGMRYRRKPRSAFGPMTVMPSGTVYLLEGVILCPFSPLSSELSG